MNFYNLLISNLNSEDPLYIRKFILINSFALVAVITFFIFGCVNFLIEENYLIATLDFTIFSIFVGMFYYIRKTKSIDRISYIISFILIFFMALFIILNKNDNFGLIWSIFMPLFAISLLGHKKGLLISIFYYVVITSILFYGLLF